jgi:hypothetical protein
MMCEYNIFAPTPSAEVWSLLGCLAVRQHRFVLAIGIGMRLKVKSPVPRTRRTPNRNIGTHAKTFSMEHPELRALPAGQCAPPNVIFNIEIHPRVSSIAP